MTRLSVCGLGVSCNEMSDTPMLLVVVLPTVKLQELTALHFSTLNLYEIEPSLNNYGPKNCVLLLVSLQNSHIIVI